METPLCNIPRIKKHWLVFLGDTLKFKKDSNGDLVLIEFNPWPLLAGLLHVIFFLAPFGRMIDYIYIQGLEYSVFIDSMKDLGFGYTDFFSQYSLIGLTLTYYFGASIMMPHMAKHLQMLTQKTATLGRKYTQIGLVSPKKNEKIYQRTVKRMLFVVILQITAAIVLAAYASILTRHVYQGIGVLTTGMEIEVFITWICWIPFACTLLCPVSVIGLELGFNQGIRFVSEALREWTSNYTNKYIEDQSLMPICMTISNKIMPVSKRDIKSKTLSKEEFQWVIAYGHEMVDLVNALNDSLALPLVAQYFYCLLSITTTGFGFATIFLSFSRLNFIQLLCCLTFGIQAMFFASRLTFTSNDSQDLANTLQTVAKDFEDYIIDCPYLEGLDVTSEKQLQELCKALKKDVPLNPYSLFVMNKSALFSAVTTSLTYIIVLLQFKTAEIPLTS